MSWGDRNILGNTNQSQNQPYSQQNVIKSYYINPGLKNNMYSQISNNASAI